MVRNTGKDRLLILFLPACLCIGCAAGIVSVQGTPNWISSFTLADQSTDLGIVDQGYASGDPQGQGSLNYFFATSALYLSSTYDSLNVIASNQQVLLPGTSHQGAGDYYSGEVYSVIEHYTGCQTSNAPIYIAIFDGTTLAREQAVEITGDLPEASGIAILPSTNEAVVSSFCDPNQLYVYDMSTWQLDRTIPLSMPVSSIQGLTYNNGFLFIASTNGRLFGLRLSDNSMRLLLQVSTPAEYEGPDFHSGQLRWLTNQGTQTLTHFLYSYNPVQ